MHIFMRFFHIRYMVTNPNKSRFPFMRKFYRFDDTPSSSYLKKREENTT